MTNFNQDAIGEEIKRAIEENEPRASVDAVAVDKDDDDSNALRVKVVYTVVGNKGEDAQITEQTTILGK